MVKAERMPAKGCSAYNYAIYCSNKLYHFVHVTTLWQFAEQCEDVEDSYLSLEHD